MSTEKFKQQAKRLQALISEHFDNKPKLSECQEMWARVLGYTSFHDAQRELAKSARNALPPRGASELEEPWAIRRDCADDQGQPTRASDLRIVFGAENALALLWIWVDNHLKERDEPPLSGSFVMAVTHCSEPGASAESALEVKFAWQQARVRLLLYPLAADTIILAGKLAEVDPSITDILKGRRGPNDVAVMETASRALYADLRANFDAYDEAHPARSLFASLDQQLKKFARERAKTAAPHELIYTATQWFVKDWRIQLLYFDGRFHFDVYHGRYGDFIAPVKAACLKLIKSGKWTAEVLRDSGHPFSSVLLEGLSRLELADLTTIAALCGIQMIVDGAPVAAAKRPTEEMRRFMDWAAEHEPSLSFDSPM